MITIYYLLENQKACSESIFSDELLEFNKMRLIYIQIYLFFCI